MLFVPIEDINQQIVYFIKHDDIVNLLQINKAGRNMIINKFPEILDDMIKLNRKTDIIILIDKLFEINEIDLVKKIIEKNLSLWR